MVDATSLSEGAALLVMIPMVGLLFFSMLKIDSLVSRPKHPRSHTLMAFGLDKNGEPIFVEPDGRPLLPVKHRR